MQPMMSNNNMLGGPREASQTTPQPNTTLVNQLIQIELEGLTLRNVALGLAIYVAISIVLFIVGTQSVATLHQWLWLSAVSCTGLSIWLWLANAQGISRPLQRRLQFIVPLSFVQHFGGLHHRFLFKRINSKQLP